MSSFKVVIDGLINAISDSEAGQIEREIVSEVRALVDKFRPHVTTATVDAPSGHTDVVEATPATAAPTTATTAEEPAPATSVPVADVPTAPEPAATVEAGGTEAQAGTGA